MNKEAIVSRKPAALGPYSSERWGIRSTLFGQLGLDPMTNELKDGVEAQAEQALTNIAAILGEVGATMQQVVKSTVLLADINDFAAVNEVYAGYFEAPYPARSAFQVAALPKGALVEIEVIAVL